MNGGDEQKKVRICNRKRMHANQNNTTIFNNFRKSLLIFVPFFCVAFEVFFSCRLMVILTINFFFSLTMIIILSEWFFSSCFLCVVSLHFISFVLFYQLFFLSISFRVSKIRFIITSIIHIKRRRRQQQRKT